MQHIVYEMNLNTVDDVAMVLPIPVASPGSDEVVAFVDLSGYETFFENIDKLFPQLTPDMSLTWGAESMAVDLPVHSVGAYVASYVPSIDAFSRLDKRFRLTSAVWEALPQYNDYGFVVFQLSQGDARFHPMAFTFPTRDPSKTFFPTTHVHNVEVHEKAKFDHVLYGQTDDCPESDWTTSKVTGAHIPGLHNWWGRDRSKGIIAKEMPLRFRSISGAYENVDVWIAS